MLRGDGLLREVMEGRLNGKKRAGKPRKVTISGLEEAFSQKKDEKSDPEKYIIRGREKE